MMKIAQFVSSSSHTCRLQSRMQPRRQRWRWLHRERRKMTDLRRNHPFQGAFYRCLPSWITIWTLVLSQGWVTLWKGRHRTNLGHCYAPRKVNIFSKLYFNWLHCLYIRPNLIKFFSFLGATFHIPLTKSATVNRLLHCSLWQFSGALFWFSRTLICISGRNRPEPPCNFCPCCTSTCMAKNIYENFLLLFVKIS